jgi:hypothetical protein
MAIAFSLRPAGSTRGGFSSHERDVPQKGQ